MEEAIQLPHNELDQKKQHSLQKVKKYTWDNVMDINLTRLFE
jgi:hypothetical protein